MPIAAYLTDMSEIIRKKNTREPGNGGEFGARSHQEPERNLSGVTQDLGDRHYAASWGLVGREVLSVGVISDTGLYKGNQSYDRQRVFDLSLSDGRSEKVRTTLHRDAYDGQSRYRAEVWNDNDKSWNEVASIPGTHPSVTENYDPEHGTPRYVCFDMDKETGASAGQYECHVAVERVNRDLLRSVASIL